MHEVPFRKESSMRISAAVIFITLFTLPIILTVLKVPVSAWAPKYVSPAHHTN